MSNHRSGTFLCVINFYVVYRCPAFSKPFVDTKTFKKQNERKMLRAPVIVNVRVAAVHSFLVMSHVLFTQPEVKFFFQIEITFQHVFSTKSEHRQRTKWEILKKFLLLSQQGLIAKTQTVITLFFESNAHIRAIVERRCYLVVGNR
jgi:hypothetical protein